MTDPAEVLARVTAALVELDAFLASIPLPETAFQLRKGEWVASPPAFLAGIRADLLSTSPRAREAATERLRSLAAAAPRRAHTPQR